MTYGGQEKSDMECPSPTYALLPCAQWMICKDQNGNGFAAKGGHNDENHNHNDIGHFLCVWQGELLLTDLGAKTSLHHFCRKSSSAPIRYKS